MQEYPETLMEFERQFSTDEACREHRSQYQTRLGSLTTHGSINPTNFFGSMGLVI